MTISKRLRMSLLCLLALARANFAQAPIGVISGTVTDESGGVIPNAKITVTNTETGLTRSLTSAGDGIYSASALPPGTYEVKAEANGFRTLSRQATVETGAVTTVNLSMQLGATMDVVKVEAATATINYESAEVSGVITRREIQNLPLNGRSFLQLAFLEPGVTVSPGSTSQYNSQFSVDIMGGGSDQTRITVDGASIVNPIEGNTQQNFSQEVVQEFQISSLNFDLSTGITGTGAVNIVTRSGTNDYHGSGYFFFRDHNMSAYPGLSRDPRNPDPFFARRQPGFYVGGPVIKNKLFFFTNFEHNNQASVVSVQPLAPEFARFGRIAPSPYIGNQVTARLDYRINQKHNWFMRYSHDGNHGIGSRSGTSFPSNWVKNVNWADQSIGSLTSALKPNLVNDARFSYTYWHNRNVFPGASDCPGDCIGLGFPQIDIVGAGFTIGNTTNAPQGRDLRRYITSDDMTWQKGSHRMRFGGEWDTQIGTGFWAFLEPAAMVLYSPAIVRLYNSDPRVPAAAHIPIPSSFNTVDDILKLPLAGFQTGIGDPSQPPPFQLDNAKTNNRFHLYWQDTWKIKPRFTLNYGVAWSYESNLLNHDLTKPDYLSPLVGQALGEEQRHPRNFSPSVGFAWSVTQDNKTVVRAGAGIYYGTFDVYKRLIERTEIGPAGAGRSPISGSLIPNPLPNIPGVPQGTPLDFTTVPTFFTGANLVSILPQLRTAVQQQLGINPNNKNLAVRTIQIVKNGSDLLPQDFSTPYYEHFNAGIQREVTRNLVVQADFVFRQDIHEEMGNIDYNHWNRVGPDGKNNPVMPVCVGFQQLDPAAKCSTGPISFRTSGGRSHYKALLLKVDKRFSRRTQFGAAYALQSNVGFNGIINNDNWFDSFGPKSPRHLLNLNGILDLPWGFQVSVISQMSSKGPFNARVAPDDFNGDGTNNDLLPGSKYGQFNFGAGKSDLQRLVNDFNQNLAGKKTSRGQQIPTLRLPSRFNFGDGFSSQDLRLTKIFKYRERYKLSVFGECFNIFNIANLSGYSDNLAQPELFGQPTNRITQVFGSGGPRAFQLGARFEF